MSASDRVQRQKCTLHLSDGNQFEGDLIGAPLIASGQMVFTTGMVGYSEALTDPSYFGQILTFTYPLIGNYGIPSLPKDLSEAVPRGFESSRVHVASVILTIDSEEAFHWNSTSSLDHWLKEQKVSGVAGLDTRQLVHLIRQTPNLLGRIVPERPEGHRDYGPELTKVADKGFFDPGAYDILPQVSTKSRRVVGKGKKRIAVVDCGVKWNIIRQLIERDCEVELLPWNTDLKQVDCSGWLLSNGPGDPTRTGNLTKHVSELLSESRPLLGICLGHQVLALAAGARTTRMPYGHRSHNQPVYQVGTRLGCMTSQNHGYVVEEGSLPEEWDAWFRNANDQTIEGIKHKTKPFRSVQFHPEAAGGPRDSGWIIEQFVAEVKA
jgi:carbamoyl-phosphate synthase small subunit